jgi:hypothetical protein
MLQVSDVHTIVSQLFSQKVVYKAMPLLKSQDINQHYIQVDKYITAPDGTTYFRMPYKKSGACAIRIKGGSQVFNAYSLANRSTVEVIANHQNQ